MSLYPFKFKAQLFHKLWGGHTIKKWYDHVPADYENVGEAWVISDIERYPTEVSNGSHAGDTLQDLLEVYMDELVGGKVYETFGNHFPVLMKFIDAADDLRRRGDGFRRNDAGTRGGPLRGGHAGAYQAAAVAVRAVDHCFARSGRRFRRDDHVHGDHGHAGRRRLTACPEEKDIIQTIKP